MTEIPGIIQALVDAPNLTNEMLREMINAEMMATRLARQKVAEIQRLRAQEAYDAVATGELTPGVGL
jgi:hypothetical protein